MTDLVADLVRLLEKDNRQDLHLVCKDGERVKVHSLILAARSQVFHKMVEEGESGVIELKEVEQDVVREFVNYLYSDQVSHNFSDLLNLLKLGHQFQVQGLVSECSRKLLSTVNIENVIEIGTVAETYQISNLSQRCAEIVAENFHNLEAEKLDTVPSSLLRKSLAAQSRSSNPNSSKTISQFSVSPAPDVTAARHFSIPSVPDTASPARTVSETTSSLSKLIQSARVWSITGCQLGNGATDFYRLNMAKSRRKKFGVYADPLSPAVEYAKHNALFEEGSPAMFWLHLNSGAMEEFQQQIQRKLNGKVGDGGGQLRPGSLVLARYRVDGQVYRAKVEHTVVVEGEVVLVRVRYIDYGNSSEIQSQEDLYTWDPLLEFVPAQAVLCTFHGAPASFLAKSSLALEERQAFTSMMSSRKKIVVHRRLHPVPLLVFRPDVCLLDKPELEVSLMDKDDTDVLGKISKHPAFRVYFGEDFQPGSVSVAPPKFLKNTPLAPLSTDRPYSSTVPPPLHLVKEPLVQVDLDQDQVVMADIVPSAPTGLEKVSSWLEKITEHTGEMSPSELPGASVNTEGHIKQKIKRDVNKNRESGVASCPGQLRKSEVKMRRPDDSNFRNPKGGTKSASNSGPKFSFPAVDIRVSDQVSCTQQMADLVVHPMMCDHCKVEPITGPMFQCNICPDFDLCHPCRQTGIHWQHEMTESQVPEAVMLEQQVVPEDVQEFDFFMSNCESPGKFYVHPLLELTARLASLEEELVSGLAGQKQVQPDHSLPLIVGGVFAVLHTEDWYRVRLEGVTSGLATLRSIDYGFLLTSVSPSELRALPSGLSRQMPGLAVCCHLAFLTPVGDGNWTREVGEELRSLVDNATIHTAIVVPGTEPSLGVLVSKKGSEVQVNQQLVDSGVAKSLILVKKETREFCWDPMREDFKTTANNYLTNDDDLEIATCGYKARGKVCQFFRNRGSCFKGDFCEDRHEVLRKGAVTTDQETTTMEMLDDIPLPGGSTTVVVRITEASSPSFFYITLPLGVRDISSLTQSDLARKKTDKFTQLEDNLQKRYAGPSKRLLLPSLPSKGELLVAKSERNKKWQRAKVLGAGNCLGNYDSDVTDEDDTVEVFFLDLGYREVVGLNHLRRLDCSFSVFPSQAVACRLAGVQPVSEGWSEEAVFFFQGQVTRAGLLTGQLVGSSGEGSLLVNLQTRLDIRDKEGLCLASLMVEKGWARRGTDTGDGEISPG